MTRLGPAPSKLRAVFVTVREAHAHGATAGEVAAANGWKPQQVAWLLEWMRQRGDLVRVGYRGRTEPGTWPDLVYVTARIASYLGPALRKDIRP